MDKILDKLKSKFFEAISSDNKIKEFINNSNFILFFKFKNNVYGAPEESRMIFAKLKERDEDEGWNREANFSASDIAKCVKGEDNQSIFFDKDMKDIKIISKEEAEKLVSSRSK